MSSASQAAMPKKKNLLPKIAMAGPVSLWMILFVTLPLMYIIFISFMSRGVFGDVVYKPTPESYQTILDPTYFKVIIKSLQAAGITTLLCILVGYPFAYIIARKPKDVAAKMITLLILRAHSPSLRYPSSYTQKETLLSDSIASVLCPFFPLWK